jgi:DNA gyrase subunit A
VEKGAGLVLITAGGMALMTRHSQIPMQGRATRGVKVMDLEEGDRVLLATQMNTDNQIAIITDAGYGKRLPYMAFSAQNRGGKGMKAVGFYKNGANGRKIVHAVCIKSPIRLEVHMASDEIYRLNPEDFPAEKLDGRGTPTDIMVVLGNEIVLCFECLE